MAPERRVARGVRAERLGLSSKLERQLSTTNAIENLIGSLRRIVTDQRRRDARRRVTDQLRRDASPEAVV